MEQLTGVQAQNLETWRHDMRNILSLAFALALLLLPISPSHAILDCGDYCTSCTAYCGTQCRDEDDGEHFFCGIYVSFHGGACWGPAGCTSGMDSVEPVAACLVDRAVTPPSQDAQPTLLVVELSEKAE